MVDIQPTTDSFKAVKHKQIGTSSYFIAENAEGFQRIERASNVGKTNLNTDRMLRLAQAQIDANNFALNLKKNQTLAFPDHHPFTIAARLKKRGLNPMSREFRRVYKKEICKVRART